MHWILPIVGSSHDLSFAKQTTLSHGWTILAHPRQTRVAHLRQIHQLLLGWQSSHLLLTLNPTSASLPRKQTITKFCAQKRAGRSGKKCRAGKKMGESRKQRKGFLQHNKFSNCTMGRPGLGSLLSDVRFGNQREESALHGHEGRLGARQQVSTSLLSASI